MTDDFYPKGPDSVPPRLTTPSARYKRHVYLAVAGLSVFLFLYFGVAAWCARASFRLFANLGRADEVFLPLFGAVCSGFIAFFMFKALFVIRRGKHEGFGIRRDQHPKLFAFLDRLATEAKAPKPHRVFLSHRVNAGVFYDLSLANLLFRSRKNLEIGLGLVNVLTLGELKAVLAHEFGHFGQGSMAIGRWIYTTQQIAGHVVAARDWLDSLLRGISSVDLRIAWIGWILRLVVWSIRSLVETAFGWVIMAQRALSREMEFQADLVAVSLTGSDALIHALHRLDAADDAMDMALGALDIEGNKERKVADVFALQSHYLKRKGEILDDPSYGNVPPLPEYAHDHRLFKAKLAHPPRMWSTHPPSESREENAKKQYLRAELDDRSSWILFEAPDQVRAEVTQSIYSKDLPFSELVSTDECIEAIEQRLDKRYHDPAYRGVYLNRSIAHEYQSYSEMIDTSMQIGDLRAALANLYPASLTELLNEHRELREEQAMLKAIERGILDMPGRMVQYRGEEFHRKELPNLIAQVDAKERAVSQQLVVQDRRLRTVHVRAAETKSSEWAAYLTSLHKVLHYAEHCRADLDDAYATYNNVLSVVLADGRVSSGELDRLTAEGSELHYVLAHIYDQAPMVNLGPKLRELLKLDSWAESLGPFDFPPPTRENVGSWVDNVGSWVFGALDHLDALYSAALNELLSAEEEVALAVSAERTLGEAPVPPTLEANYASFCPGSARPKQTRLGWWDRFQTADGWFPGLARMATAGAMVGVVIWASGSIGNPEVTIVNGLGIPVEIQIGELQTTVQARSQRRYDLEPGAHTVVTRTKNGKEIERFEADVDDGFSRYLYNVANATTFATWEPGYGNETPMPAKAWQEINAARVERAGAYVSAKIGDDPILVSFADAAPAYALGYRSAETIPSLVRAHVRWDSVDHAKTSTWFELGKEELEDFPALVEERIAAGDRSDPQVFLRRYQQDVGDRAASCADSIAKADEFSDTSGWQYLAARCEDNEEAQRELFASLAQDFPSDPWIAYYSLATALDNSTITDALAMSDRLHNLGPMQESVTDLQIRLSQAAQEREVDLTSYAKDYPRYAWIHWARGQSGAQGDDPTNQLMGALYRGDLAAAASQAVATGADYWSVLIGASDGANQDMIDAALALDPADLGVAVYMEALARREGRDPEIYAVHAEHSDEQRASRFLAAIASQNFVVTDQRSLEAAETELIGTSIGGRGMAYAAAVVLLGTNTPSEWRNLARYLLFVGERPYIQ